MNGIKVILPGILALGLLLTVIWVAWCYNDYAYVTGRKKMPVVVNNVASGVKKPAATPATPVKCCCGKDDPKNKAVTTTTATTAAGKSEGPTKTVTSTTSATPTERVSDKKIQRQRYWKWVKEGDSQVIKEEQEKPKKEKGMLERFKSLYGKRFKKVAGKISKLSQKITFKKNSDNTVADARRIINKIKELKSKRMNAIMKGEKKRIGKEIDKEWIKLEALPVNITIVKLRTEIAKLKLSKKTNDKKRLEVYKEIVRKQEDVDTLLQVRLDIKTRKRLAELYEMAKKDPEGLCERIENLKMQMRRSQVRRQEAAMLRRIKLYEAQQREGKTQKIEEKIKAIKQKIEEMKKSFIKKYKYHTSLASPLKGAIADEAC